MAGIAARPAAQAAMKARAPLSAADKDLLRPWIRARVTAGA